MWPMGTASSGLPGYRFHHIARETSPCSDETALARRESLSPSTVMQNVSLRVVGEHAAEAHQVFVREPKLIAQRARGVLR